MSHQIHALIATAPDELRDQLRDLTTRKRVAVAARWRPDRQADSVTTTTKLPLKKLARRFLDLDTEIKELSRQLDQLVEATAPRLVARRGIGTHTAATLLVTAGDNPERLRLGRIVRRPDRQLTPRGLVGPAQDAPAQPRR